MLAEDVVPNRLERAKAEVRDLLVYLEGDQVGLIGFAGRASVLVPLTPDFGFFRLVLDEVGPHSVTRGGTRLEEPIRKAIEGFRSSGDVTRVILLITDGEDHDTDPHYAAGYAYQDHGVRTFAIGLGDAVAGRRVPVEDDGRTGYAKEEDGSEHYSKMNAGMLESIARAGGEGFAVPAGTAQIDMAEFYERMRGKLDPQEYLTQRQERFVERYQWFAAAALALLIFETLMTDRKPRTAPAVERQAAA